MAWAQEIIDFVLKSKPWTTVNEYQVGLYFWLGKVVEWKVPKKKFVKILKERKRGTQITIEEIIAQEKTAREQYKKTHVLSEGWHQGLFTGKLYHPERYSKNRPHGVYFHIPPLLDLSRVETVPIKEVVKNIDFISILVDGYQKSRLILSPSKNSASYLKEKIGDISLKPVGISGFTRYEIEDGYKAYTQVQDWEQSYQTQILGGLAKLCREANEDIYNPATTERIERDLKNNINSSHVRREWGIWTSEIKIITNAPHEMTRNIQELRVAEEGLKIAMENFD